VTVPTIQRAGLPVALGLIAFVVSFAGSWIPSFWSDEVATVRAVSLPLPDLFEFLAQKDAVHGTYDIIIHAWSQVFGTSELALRAPSAIAVGVAAAGLVVIGRQLRNPWLGVIAAAIFTLLPRTTYMAAEARSYAMTAAVAVVLTIAFLAVRSSGRVIALVIYAVVAICAMVLFVYLGMLVVAHLAALLLLRPQRRVVIGFAITAAISVGVVAPFLRVALGQRGQIAWLASQPSANPWTVLVEPWFDSSVAVAIAAWGLVLFAIVRWRVVRRATGDVALVVAICWVVVPTVLLLVANVASGPLYTARYLSFCAPGIALVLAAAITAIPIRWAAPVSIAMLMLLAAPTYVGQRTELAKNGGSDLRQIAETVHENATAGDAILFGDGATVALDPRQALYGYPDRFARLKDVALVRSFPETGIFSDQTVSLVDTYPRLDGIGTVWFVGTQRAGGCAAAVDALSNFAVAREIALHRTTVCEFVRR
jgi:mannosyltransferase